MSSHRKSIQCTTRAAPHGRHRRVAGLLLVWAASCLATDVAHAGRAKSRPWGSTATPHGLATYTDRPVDGSSQRIMSLGRDTRNTVWMTMPNRRTDPPVAARRQTSDQAIEHATYVTPPSYRASATRNARREALEPLIERVARAHDIETALLLAVVDVESGFNANAISSKGARGLGQVMPATAARYGKFNLFSPAENLTVSSLYLRDLLKMFRGDIRLALAAYNAGEGAVLRYGNRIPPYAETRHYVPIVLARYHSYRNEPARKQQTLATAGSARSPAPERENVAADNRPDKHDDID